MESFEFVIVGAGPAGGRAAAELTSLGEAARTLLIGAESYPPYERPPLSKALLKCEAAPEVPCFGGSQHLADKGVRLLYGRRATTLDRSGKTLQLDDGQRVGYGRLLLATGTRARQLPLPGASLPGIHVLRDFDDLLAIRASLARPGRPARVVVIGGGFIGLECAASACALGHAVCVVEAGPQAMGRAVPELVARRFEAVHRSHGVDLRLSTQPRRFIVSDRVEGVELASGEVLPADLVIVGIGVVPETGLAQAAGLEIDNGIVTDRFMRTSDPDVFAAGDVASTPIDMLGGQRARQEAWQSALDQATAAARTMVGKATPYDKLPWVWSDQYDMNLQLCGLPRDVDQLVTRPGGSERALTVLQLSQKRLVGAITIDNGKDMALLRRAVGSAREHDPARLADVSLKLRDVLT